MESALLFRLGGLGDLLVCLPSLNLLRQALSPCFLTLVCREEYGSLLLESGIVDSLISVDDARLTSFFKTPPYPVELLRWLEGYSLVMGWMQKPAPAEIENLLFSRKQGRCRFIVYDPASKEMVSRFFFKSTSDFLSKERKFWPSFRKCSLLPLMEGQKDQGLRLLGKEASNLSVRFAVVHPGSGSKSKCWPVENFLKTVKHLSSQGFEGALVLGEAEERLEKSLAYFSPPSGWVWLRRPPLSALAGLLSSCHLYLGNDSGITHLAAASGARVIALFRAGLKDSWRPFGKTTVLSAPSVPEISLHAVWEAIEHLYSY